MSPRPHNNITFYCRTNIHSDQVRLGVVGRTMYIFIQVVLRLDSQQRPSVRTASVLLTTGIIATMIFGFGNGFTGQFDDSKISNECDSGI